MAFDIFGSEAGSSATEDEATAVSEDTTPDPASASEPLVTEGLQNDMKQTSLEEPPSEPEEPTSKPEEPPSLSTPEELHSTIIKHMKDHLSSVTHYFDLWHLKKKLIKVLSKISKLKGFVIITDWIQPCVNHLHWSVTTTFSGDGNLILAKFKSFLGHIVNKHKDLSDPLFNQCAHNEDIAPRTWLKEESDEYEKLAAALSKTRLQNGGVSLSPDDFPPRSESAISSRSIPGNTLYYIGVLPNYCRNVVLWRIRGCKNCWLVSVERVLL
eukprot:gene15953-7283_t